MALDIIMHPFSLTVTFIFSVIFVRDLVINGRRRSVIYKCVNKHIKVMSKKDFERAWDGLSFDLKTTLTQKKRLKQGPDFFGSKRVEKFAQTYFAVYNQSNLAVESVHRVRRAKAPKVMYMVRLRSKKSGYMRMTMWVSHVPNRLDGWSVDEVCVHPPNGDINKGETLTGARMRNRKTRIKKKVQDRANRRSEKTLSKAS